MQVMPVCSAISYTSDQARELVVAPPVWVEQKCEQCHCDPRPVMMTPVLLVEDV